jgi:hypothetical protein
METFPDLSGAMHLFVIFSIPDGNPSSDPSNGATGLMPSQDAILSAVSARLRPCYSEVIASKKCKKQWIIPECTSRFLNSQLFQKYKCFSVVRVTKYTTHGGLTVNCSTVALFTPKYSICLASAGQKDNVIIRESGYWWSHEQCLDV